MAIILSYNNNVKEYLQTQLDQSPDRIINLQLSSEESMHVVQNIQELQPLLEKCDVQCEVKVKINLFNKKESASQEEN